MARAKHRIGRFRVIAPIGAGGFSTVYRGLDEANGREVALKVLAENHSLVSDTRRRFVEEFELRGAVSSPYIADVFEVGETESGQPFMVVELADRGDLRRRVEELRQAHHVMTRMDLLNLARHLTEALSALHNADIVHRDVSPGNILIRSRPSVETSRARSRLLPEGAAGPGPTMLLEPGERLLLADLGHAKDLLKASGFTAGGGTQGFAAPEQRDDVTMVDHRADIFSATAIIEWAAHGGPYADDLESFYDIGLAAEPDNRFPSMTEWYQAIAAILGPDERFGRSRNRRRRGGKAKPEVVAVAPPGPSDTAQLVAPRAVAATGPAWGRRFALLAAVVLLVVTPVGLVLGYRWLIDRTGDSDQPTSTAEAGPVDQTTQTTLVVVGGEPGSEDDSAGQRPWAALAEPPDGAIIDGELTISGTANNDGGVAWVEVEVEQVTTGKRWSPAEGGFTVDGDGEIDQVGRFTVDLADPGTGSFEASIPAASLEPGRYVVRVWAVGTDSEEPAEPTTRTVVVS